MTGSTFAILQEIASTRANPGIDPSLEVWGLEVAVYLFLGGLAGGLLALAAWFAGSRKKAGTSRTLGAAPLLALVFLSLGMVALFLDLEHPSRVWRFYAAFRPSSPMSWGAWILLLVYPAGIALWFLTSGRAGEVARSMPSPSALQRAVRRLGAATAAHPTAVRWIGLSAGVLLALYTGILLGTLGARPLWNSAVLGPLFLVSGLSTAAALLLLLRPNAREATALLRFDIAAIAVELALVGLLFVELASGGRAAREAASVVLAGPWTGPFFALVVFLGLVTPLVLEITESAHGALRGWAAPVLVLLGGFALRYILLAAGQDWSYGLI